MLWGPNKRLPVLSLDRARWSQRFCPSSGRAVAPTGGSRGTAASLPTTLSSVLSTQVALYVPLCNSAVLCCVALCRRASCCVPQRSTPELCCLVAAGGGGKKSAGAESIVSPQARESSTGGEERSCGCELFNFFVSSRISYQNVPIRVVAVT